MHLLLLVRLLLQLMMVLHLGRVVMHLMMRVLVALRLVHRPLLVLLLRQRPPWASSPVARWRPSCTPSCGGSSCGQ